MSEIGNSIEANAKTHLAAVPTPRLSIAHLMLWTLCCAVYWALIRAVNAISTTHIVPELLSSIVKGAVFAGVITLISARVRGEPPLLKQPGTLVAFHQRDLHVDWAARSSRGSGIFSGGESSPRSRQLAIRDSTRPLTVPADRVLRLPPVASAPSIGR